MRSAVAAQNANQAKGALDDGGKMWMIRANDQLTKAKDYKNLVIAYRNGAPVRLSDVADVQDSYSNIYNAGSFNGKPSVLIVIFRQPGANVIATADRVIAALPFLKASLPPSINLDIGLDRTTTVRASGERCAAHADHFRHPGGAGGLRFSARGARHLDSQRCRAAGHRRHLRRDVPVRLFAE